MYRWLCSPASRLHDPALKAAVQGLMRKLLLQLVAELRRLGATVVAADTSSIILATGKHGLASALGYVDYVLDTLRRRELFQWLALAPSRCWHTLLFADRYNFMGVAAPLPRGVAAAMSQRPGELASGGGALEAAAGELAISAASLRRPAFDCVLTMRDYLPPALHDAFTSAVAEFVWLPWKHAVGAALEGAAAAAAAGEGSGETAGAAGGEGGGPELAGLGAAQEAWLAAALPGAFTDKLLRAVKHASLHMGARDGRPEHRFPRLAGSHLPPERLGTPALALVRSVAHLYSLDGAAKEAVTVLRRQLLRLIHVKEFGAEAAWADPCMTLVLPDAVCPGCQDCADLDLCRDPRLQARDWRCGGCGAARDVAGVEARLAAQLAALTQGYQVQDLRCAKCASVATNHLQRQCDVCGGHLGATQAAGRAAAQVAVYRNVAAFHGMDALEEVAAWALGEGEAPGEGEAE
jgi:DNA polymerase epsilon subunit 1